jgi:hypothetical protein
LTHSDNRSPGAELLMSPRLRMPIIRLLLLITGNLRTCSFSMCRTALARSSSSRQQWMPGVITWRAVARRASKLSYVTLTHQFCEFGHRRVWTDPVDALVHCVFDFHGRPPLLKFAYQPQFPSRLTIQPIRFLWHRTQHRHTEEFFLSRSGTISEPPGIYPTSSRRQAIIIKRQRAQLSTTPSARDASWSLFC